VPGPTTYPRVAPTPEIQPGEAGRGEIVERSESARDQGGPMFGGCLMLTSTASVCRRPRRSLLEAIEPFIGARAFGIPPAEASRDDR